jgi:hypothetical protein
MIAHWKGVLEKYTLHRKNLTPSTVSLWREKNKCLGPQNNPGSTTRCPNMKTYKIIHLD